MEKIRKHEWRQFYTYTTTKLIITLITCFATQTTAGTLEINPIENNQGFILFESGTIQIPITFMHCLTINITEVEETFNSLVKNLKTLHKLNI